MTLRLYQVDATITAIIAAEEWPTTKECETAVANEAREYSDDIGSDLRVVEVTHVENLPPGWAESIPWGQNSSNATCRALLRGVGR